MMRRVSRSRSPRHARPSRSRSPRGRHDAPPSRRRENRGGHDGGEPPWRSGGDREPPWRSGGDRRRGGDRHGGGMPDPGAMWGQYPGYGGMQGAPGYGGQAGYGGMPGVPFMGGDEKKKKKRKKKRAASGSSSSSSSSSSVSDWRNKVWKRGFQGNMPGMPGWPGMPGQMPGMPGQMPGMWPGMQGQWPQPGGHMPGAPSGSMGPGGSGESIMEPHPGGRGSGGWNGPPDRQEPPEEDVPIFLEAAVEEMVPVPKALLGKVIGKQAQTIIEIREKSGAFKVDARDQTTDPCLVKVAGTAEAVKKAKVLIMELIENTKSKHGNSEFVEIPRAKIGMVIGLKGAQVNEIQMQTGTKIDVDFEADPCRCYIKGDMDCVLKAKQVLLTIAMQIEDDRSEYLDLPKTASGALIGAQGSRVRDFQEQSGARIDVDKTGARCRVRLSGTGDQVANAKALILYEVENAPATNTSSHPGMMPPLPQQPMQIPSHQPTSFPATVAESIARAKAAAQAVKSGIISNQPEEQAGMSSGFGFPVPSQAPGMSW